MKMSSLVRGIRYENIESFTACYFYVKKLFDAQLVHKRRLCCLAVSWHLALLTELLMVHFYC